MPTHGDDAIGTVGGVFVELGYDEVPGGAVHSELFEHFGEGDGDRACGAKGDDVRVDCVAS